MPINYPANRKEVADRIKTDIQNLLPQLEPFLRDSYIAALATADAGRVYDLYIAIKALQAEMFPDTADGEFLERWGSYKNLTRNQATQSTGRMTVIGVNGTLLPINTVLQSSNGLAFTTTESKNIISQLLIIASIVRSGNVATVTTASDNHHLANGINVTISGAVQPEYNVTAPVTVTGKNTFTYLVIGNPVTPATTISTLQYAVIAADIAVQSIDYGLQTNLVSGNELFFGTPIAGAASAGVVQFEGLNGGTDLENDEDFRKRILYAYQHPISYFNVSEITTLIQTINYVTRVFIQEITPATGQVTIYFVCDKQDNIIPSAEQVAEVKNKVLTIKPAPVDPTDVIVNPPVPKVIDFQFLSLEPNTQSMQDAIRANLKAMFSEVPIVGHDLSRYSYQSAIFQSVDPTNGQFVTNYTLSTPTTDIPINKNELAILGNISFPT